MTPIALSWSGGKDCTLALEALRAVGNYEITCLLTTLNEAHGRISMHGVREALLERQAAALDLPLRKVFLPEKADNETYNAAMGKALDSMRAEGIETVAFGDIFLADIRAYREDQMRAAGLAALFPLWGQSTRRLSAHFIERGYRAVLTCIDTEAISADFAGRQYDHELLADLPASCDPCGENGEFHSFVSDGPAFGEPIPVKTGERVLRDERFQFCDLVV
jgi:uncharacterized protein (TIGR00290 family)